MGNSHAFTTSFDKIVGTKFRRLSNYSPRFPGTMLKHQISFLSDTWATNIVSGVWGGDHALRKDSAMQTPKEEFQCIRIKKNYGITNQRFSDFVSTNFVKDCSYSPLNMLKNHPYSQTFRYIQAMGFIGEQVIPVTCEWTSNRSNKTVRRSRVVHFRITLIFGSAYLLTIFFFQCYWRQG